MSRKLIGSAYRVMAGNEFTLGNNEVDTIIKSLDDGVLGAYDPKSQGYGAVRSDVHDFLKMYPDGDAATFASSFKEFYASKVLGAVDVYSPGGQLFKNYESIEATEEDRASFGGGFVLKDVETGDEYDWTAGGASGSPGGWFQTASKLSANTSEEGGQDIYTSNLAHALGSQTWVNFIDILMDSILVEEESTVLSGITSVKYEDMIGLDSIQKGAYQPGYKLGVEDYLQMQQDLKQLGVEVSDDHTDALDKAAYGAKKEADCLGNPGDKIRSDGEGRGLGIGRGLGPVGRTRWRKGSIRQDPRHVL